MLHNILIFLVITILLNIIVFERVLGLENDCLFSLLGPDWDSTCRRQSDDQVS